jgi:hypothetical protein
MKMKQLRANLITASAVTAGLALAGTALADTQRGPNSYPYCAMSGESATICYFDSRTACVASGAVGGCIDNPGFAGGNAMARATVRRSHKPRQ